MSFSPLDSALLGPLTTTAAMAALFADRALLANMRHAEWALATAQEQPELAAALAAMDLDMDLDMDLGPATALAVVPTIPFVAAIQARLPGALAAGFHRGATTQDILDTATVLQWRGALALLATDLGRTMDALATMAATHRQLPCAARTYGQQAAPITFGLRAAQWLAGLADVAAMLPGLRTRLLVASLGGPVGALPQGPGVLDTYAAALGLGTPPLAWHTRRAAVAEAGSWLAILLGALAKFATDVAQLASTEVMEVAEPWMPGRGGSSAMPHKRNPIGATVILAAALAAPGHAATLIHAMAAAGERPAGAWHAEWQALPPLFGLAAGALREGLGLAEGLVLDPARMAANLGLTNGLLFADAAAAALAPTLGRAAAHARVEQAAHEVRATGPRPGRHPWPAALRPCPRDRCRPALDRPRPGPCRGRPRHAMIPRWSGPPSNTRPSRPNAPAPSGTCSAPSPPATPGASSTSAAAPAIRPRS